VFPQFVFADVDRASPGHGETAWFDMRSTKYGRILKRPEERRLQQRLDVVELDDAVFE